MAGSPPDGSWEGRIFQGNRTSGGDEQSIDEVGVMHLVKNVRISLIGEKRENVIVCVGVIDLLLAK